VTAIDAALLRRFCELAGERLEGDWVVLGGTVLPLLGVERRITLDIDVAGPEDASNAQVLALMDIALELGLPIEVVNQAGAWFLHRIEGWRRNVVPVHRGPRATVHRPDATLFVLLKIGRLSESDLDDCLAMLERARERAEPVDAPRIAGAIREALGAGEISEPKRARLERLSEVVGGPIRS